MDLKKIHRIFMLGIGGIGMSALARYFLSKGLQVSGYDQNPSKITDSLMEEGVSIQFQADIAQIPWQADLVVYTPAIPEENLLFQYFLNAHTLMKKRAVMLGEISRGKFTIAVAGSHGKTSVSAMITYLLRQHGIKCTALIGGIMKNYKSNFVAGDDQIFVVEADEYDRSFLALEPDIAIITAIDADHLDVYKSEKALHYSFSEFLGKMKPGGILISKQGLKLDAGEKGIKHQTYAIENPSADYSASDLVLQSGKTSYYINYKGKRLSRVQTSLSGKYNVENTMAAIVSAQHTGIKCSAMSSTLEDFEGIERRFDIILDRPGLLVINDYAHHPKEIEALIESVKLLHPHRRVSVLFQPHLYSRTKDMYQAFADALNLADEVLLLPIYAAREKSTKGISSILILKRLQTAVKMLIEKSKILDSLNIIRPEILLIVGAGDIDSMVGLIKENFIAQQEEEK